MFSQTYQVQTKSSEHVFNEVDEEAYRQRLKDRLEASARPAEHPPNGELTLNNKIRMQTYGSTGLLRDESAVSLTGADNRLMKTDQNESLSQISMSRNEGRPPSNDRGQLDSIFERIHKLRKNLKESMGGGTSESFKGSLGGFGESTRLNDN